MMAILWPIMGLCVVISAFFAGYAQGVKDGEQVIRAEWDIEKETIITAQRDKEAALQASMDKLRTEKNNELARLNTTVRSLNASLRSRPERPSAPAVPEVASAGDGGGWCSGPQLYRNDAQLALSEAERADRIRLQLIQCQTAYEKARQASNAR